MNLGLKVIVPWAWVRHFPRGKARHRAEATQQGGLAEREDVLLHAQRGVDDGFVLQRVE